MDQSLLPKELQAKEKTELPKHTNKVAIGNARIKKRTLGEKLASVFVYENFGQSLAEYIIWDQLVPTIRDGIYRMVTGTMDMLFYNRFTRGGGGPRPKSNQYWSPPSETTYSYDRVNDRRVRDGGYSRPRPNSSYVEPVVVDTYNDAAAVLDELLAYLEKYGRVPVSAYYDSFGVTSGRDWTNQNWGWTTLREARVVSVRGGGYTLEMPNPEAI